MELANCTHSISATAIRLADSLLGWIERSRERGQLAALDDRALADLGIGRGEAEQEVRKGFWQK
ncbi:MAG: DUF1127 domain-containing protein [Solirubrobacterales bacterium]